MDLRSRSPTFWKAYHSHSTIHPTGAPNRRHSPSGSGNLRSRCMLVARSPDSEGPGRRPFPTLFTGRFPADLRLQITRQPLAQEHPGSEQQALDGGNWEFGVAMHARGTLTRQRGTGSETLPYLIYEPLRGRPTPPDNAPAARARAPGLGTAGSHRREAGNFRSRCMLVARPPDSEGPGRRPFPTSFTSRFAADLRLQITRQPLAQEHPGSEQQALTVGKREFTVAMHARGTLTRQRRTGSETLPHLIYEPLRGRPTPPDNAPAARARAPGLGTAGS